MRVETKVPGIRLASHVALLGLIDDSLSRFMTISSLELQILAARLLAFPARDERSGARLQLQARLAQTLMNLYRHLRPPGRSKTIIVLE